MFSLGRKQAPLLGIDIGSTAVKLIELSHARTAAAHTYRVESWAVEPMPPAAIVERKIADPDVVSQAIRKALTRSGSRAKRCAVASPGSAVITKTISLPAALSDTEMESRIQLDADQYIPYPMSEVDLDFTVLGPSAIPGDVDVLLAAARNEIVDALVAVMDLAGIETVVIDVEPYALENACILAMGAQAEDHTLAIADVGTAATRIQVVRGGRTVYTREQGFAGAQLLEEIGHRYSLTPEEARKRLSEGTLPPDYPQEIGRPFGEALAQQIGRALQFFYSATFSPPADQILLAGGAARLPGIEQVIGQRLGIMAYVANPFLHMAFAPQVVSAELDQHAPAMALATGLALRRFD